MHSRNPSLVATMLLVCLTITAEARTWTSREGKQIEADFVDVDDERVTLKLSSGKQSVIKLDLLCDDDQTYLRGVYARRKSKSSTITDDDNTKPAINLNTIRSSKPDESSDEDEGDSSPSRATVKPANRTWTDLLGKQSSGKFIRVQGNTVVLLRGGRQATIDYWQLTPEDQAYVKEILEAKGQTALIPTVKPNAIAANGTGNGGMGNAAAGMGAGGMPMMPNVAVPNFTPPASLPVYNPPNTSAPISTFPGSSVPSSSYPSSSYPSAMPPTNSYPGSSVASSLPPTTYPGSSYPGSSMPNPSMPSNSMPNYIPPAMSMPPMPDFSSPQYQQVKICSNCRKEVPSSIGAGNSCPHCGTFFAYDDVTGKKASPFSNLSIRGGAGLVKLVIVGVMALFGVGAAAVSAMSGIFRGKKPETHSEW